jgi:hypothetical protein
VLVTTTAHLVPMTTMRRLMTLMPMTTLMMMSLLMTWMATSARIHRNETGETQGKSVPLAGDGSNGQVEEIQFEPCLSDSKWLPDIPLFSPLGKRGGSISKQRW